jgi:hypothetical protein
MKKYGRVEAPPFLASALGGEWSASRHSRNNPVTNWIGGSVDPTAGLDAVENRKISSHYRKSNSGRPVRLYND